MRICVILNPAAGSAEQATALHDLLSSREDIIVKKTEAPSHARELAAEALHEGFELIVAAGGDGTISEVVNGLAGAAFERAPEQTTIPTRFGLIPLGTGNDLARTLAIPTDPVEAFRLLEEGRERVIDLIKVESAGEPTVYCINVSAGGFSGQVNEAMTPELKKTWGPFSYLLGAAAVIPNLNGYETKIFWDNGPVEHIQALNIIVANCRTAAGGFQAAPLANPEDGLLEVVIVYYVPFLNLVDVAARLMMGNYMESEHVLYRQAKTVRIDSHPGMWFNVDGELITNEPITFSIIPRAIPVIVGPEYTPVVQL